MKELIKITKNEEGQQLVSARELHEFLEVGKVFGAWINERINKYCFKENIDFTILWSDSKNGNAVEFNGNANSMSAKGYIKEYIITLDMAKELSMVENNDKGRQARKYFIKCEEKLREELKNKELTEADKINKLLTLLPAEQRGEYMLKLVDKFYPTGNSKPIKEAKPKYESPIGLTLDKVVDILRQAYNEAFMAVRSNYIVFNKEITYKYSSYNGIGKRELNRFLLENNLVKIEKSSIGVTCTCSINKKKIKALYIKADIFNN